MGLIWRGQGELAFLWLLKDLSRTSTAGPDRPVGRVVQYSLLPVQCEPDSATSKLELVTYKVKNLFGLSSDFSKFSSHP